MSIQQSDCGHGGDVVAGVSVDSANFATLTATASEAIAAEII